jgi:hypothetical protein
VTTTNDEWAIDQDNVEMPVEDRGPQYTRLMWNTGWIKTVANPNKPGDRKAYSGFLVTVGNETVDEAFTTLGVPRSYIRYNDGKIEEAWLLQEIDVIFPTRKLVPVVKDLTKRFFQYHNEPDKIDRGDLGMAIGWKPNRAEVKEADGSKKYKIQMSPKGTGWPTLASYVEAPVLLYRIKGIDRLVTDVLKEPLVIIHNGTIVSKLTDAQIYWRDDVMNRILSSQKLGPVLRTALTAQYDGMLPLLPQGTEAPPKKLMFHATAVTLGYTGVYDAKNRDGETSEMQEFGCIVPETPTPEWVKSLVITPEVRAYVESLVPYFVAWSAEREVYLAKPKDFTAPSDKEKNGEGVTEQGTTEDAPVTRPSSQEW